MQTSNQTFSFTSNGTNLTPYDVARVARSPVGVEDGRPEVRVGMSPEAVQRVEHARR